MKRFISLLLLLLLVTTLLAACGKKGPVRPISSEALENPQEQPEAEKNNCCN